MIMALFFPLLFLLPAYAEQVLPSVDFQDAAVLDVVNILARQANLNVVVSGDTSSAQNKRTSLHLSNITPREAIEHVLKTNGLDYENKGDVILITVAQAEEVYPGEIKTINLKYLSAEKVGALIEKVIPSLKTAVGGSANSIVLKGKGNQMVEAFRLIDSIDRPVPQILIESKVVEIAASDSMRLGLSYGSPAGTVQFITDKTTRKTSLKDDLLTTLNGLVSDGKAKVIATPKIATLDNHTAVINIGSRIPYAVPVTNGSNSITWTVDYIDAGVKLKITPMLGKDNTITTDIEPEVSCVSEWKTTSAGEFPVISTRNAQSTVRVNNGDTIVIGGLMSEVDRENVSRLPIIGYLPILGILFQSKTTEKSKTEVVFMITPHVI